jgi:signal transduction histidine kinase
MSSQFTSRKKALVALILAITVMVALITLNEIGYMRSYAATESIVQVLQRRAALHQLLQQTLDAETNQRGYLLTGDEAHLVPYSEAVAKTNGSLEMLRNAYTAHRVDELTRFDELSRTVSRKIKELEITIKLRRSGIEGENLMTIVRTNAGRDYMNAVRTAAHDLIALSTAEIMAIQKQIEYGLIVSRAGISLAALMALLVFVLYLRQAEKLNSANESQSRTIAEERDQLEALVRERTSRLTQLADHLQVVQEAEREHLARELHDELGALLTAAKLDIARMRSKLPDTTDPITQRVVHLNETLNAVIALKRRIVEDLRPSSLSNLGLVPALEILTREFARSAAVTVTLKLEPLNTTPEIALALYRVAQESLTNIGRYAHAKNVVVRLCTRGEFIELNIDDDGRGFDVGERLNASHGLAGMRHRADALNGGFDVTSVEGRGTSIKVVIPSPAAAALAAISVSTISA